MGLKRISDEVKGINRNMYYLVPNDNPIMIMWIEEYLWRIKKIKANIYMYTVTKISEFSCKHKLYRLFVWDKGGMCYDLSLYNFKKFCRTNNLSMQTAEKLKDKIMNLYNYLEK